MEQRIIDFCGQWTVPLISSSPPAFISVSMKNQRDMCPVCHQRRCSIRPSQLVLFRDYIGTRLTISAVNQGGVSHYEHAPTYTLVLPRMCGTCEDRMVDVIHSQDYERAFSVDYTVFTECLQRVRPLIDIINQYLKLDDTFMG